jgi:hypothetical protein
MKMQKLTADEIEWLEGVSGGLIEFDTVCDNFKRMRLIIPGKATLILNQNNYGVKLLRPEYEAWLPADRAAVTE